MPSTRYPESRIDTLAETLHGVEVPDPYRWLEDQQSPETRAWIEAQNACTQDYLDRLTGRDLLERRLGKLMKVDSVGVPFDRGGRYFFSKRRRDQDLAVLSMRRGSSGGDEVLVDPHPMSPDHTTSVYYLEVSRDGSLAAYAVQKGGEDEVEVRLLDVETREDLPDRLPRGRYSGVSMLPDKSGFYYVRYFTEEGPRLYFHRLGDDAATDGLVFGDAYGPGVGMGASVSEDGRYLLIHVSHGWVRTEIHLQNLAVGGPILPIVDDLESQFHGDIAEDRLFVQTDWNAPNGRIVEIDLLNPARDRWRERVPESAAVIQGFTLAGGKLCVSALENVVSRVKLYAPDGTFCREIAFPAIGSVSGLAGRWSSDEAFFVFSSYAIPPTIYRYSVGEGKQEVWFHLDVPVESDRFTVKQAWYESKDGTRIPMFVAHAKDLKQDGSNPALLTGYGGFNASLTPGFSAMAVVWMERGGVFAVPNLRGGGEFGERWHRAGMFGQKQNVFDDFIAAAEWLVKNRYTRPEKLAISGGSNGGLLVGAALTQRPDLFGAVVCSYPLLDMVRYQQFLVARFWVTEYGSSEDPEQFPYLHAYSPYHRVRPGARYPATLFITGDADTRVDPLHARKMAALLQSSTGSDHPVLLRYDTKLGHSGGRPVSKQIDDLTDTLGFLLAEVGGR